MEKRDEEHKRILSAGENRLCVRRGEKKRRGIQPQRAREHRRRGMLRVAAGILTENNLCVLCVLCGEKEKRELTTENAESTEKVGKLRVTAAILAGNSLCVLCILHGAG